MNPEEGDLRPQLLDRFGLMVEVHGEQEAEARKEVVRRRLLVKPGMTGLWQVSGRSDLPWDETVRLDVYYVDNWSVMQDLSILMRTAGAVLGSRGAY